MLLWLNPAVGSHSNGAQRRCSKAVTVRNEQDDKGGKPVNVQTCRLGIKTPKQTLPYRRGWGAGGWGGCRIRNVFINV